MKAKPEPGLDEIKGVAFTDREIERVTNLDFVELVDTVTEVIFLGKAFDHVDDEPK